MTDPTPQHLREMADQAVAAAKAHQDSPYAEEMLYLCADRLRSAADALERMERERDEAVHKRVTDNKTWEMRASVAESALSVAIREREEMRKAFERALIGVNHIATYRTAKWPDPGTDHEIALERLGAGREYDMWCCWNAAMVNRAALSRPAPPQGG